MRKRYRKHREYQNGGTPETHQMPDGTTMQGRTHTAYDKTHTKINNPGDSIHKNDVESLYLEQEKKMLQQQYQFQMILAQQEFEMQMLMQQLKEDPNLIRKATDMSGHMDSIQEVNGLERMNKNVTKIKGYRPGGEFRMKGRKKGRGRNGVL